MSKPTIVIVPGGFSKGVTFTKLIEPLTANGYEVTALDHQTTGRRDPDPPATFTDDVANFRNIVAKLVDDGKDVVVVAHSYGGVVATEGAENLSKNDRKAVGKEGGIVRLLYLAAVAPPVGGSALSVMKDVPFDYVSFDDKGYMTLKPTEAAATVFSDLPSEVGEYLISMCEDQAVASFAGELSYPAYKFVPVSFIITAEDKVLPASLQEEMAQMVEKESRKNIRRITLATGHAPHASQPETLTKVIIEEISRQD